MVKEFTAMTLRQGPLVRSHQRSMSPALCFRCPRQEFSASQESEHDRPGSSQETDPFTLGGETTLHDKSTKDERTGKNPQKKFRSRGVVLCRTSGFLRLCGSVWPSWRLFSPFGSKFPRRSL